MQMIEVHSTQYVYNVCYLHSQVYVHEKGCTIVLFIDIVHVTTLKRRSVLKTNPN